MQPINLYWAAARHNSPRTPFVPNQNINGGFDIEDSVTLSCRGLVDNDMAGPQSACLSSIARTNPKITMNHGRLSTVREKMRTLAVENDIFDYWRGDVLRQIFIFID